MTDPSGRLMCIVSIHEDSNTPKRLEPAHRLGDSFDCPLVLLDDVVEVLFLTHQDIHTSICLDTFNCSRIGTALVNGDLNVKATTHWACRHLTSVWSQPQE